MSRALELVFESAEQVKQEETKWLDKRYMQEKSVISSRMNGEVVLLCLTSGQFYGLGSTGSHIWDALREEHSIRELAQQLQQVYQVESDVCQQETAAFVHRLEQAGMLRSACEHRI